MTDSPNSHSGKIDTYLYFNGRCEEAITFYKQSLGAEVVMLMRFKESPDPAMIPPGSAEKVMHAAVRIGESNVLLSDGRCAGQAKFEGFALTLSVRTEAEADRAFNALQDGGQILMPLTKTFYSPRFGMVADRFGVMWMVMVVTNP